MPEKTLSFGGIHFGTAPQAEAREIDPEAPFRILICGDFSGRFNRGVCEPGAKLAARKPVMIDRDNFDEILEQANVRLDRVLSDAAGAPIAVTVKELDDFHPDQLYTQIPLFDALSSTRRRLLNTSTFNQAAAEVQSWAKIATAPTSAPVAQAEPAEERPAGIEIPDDLFGEMLSNTEQAARARAPADDWKALIQSIVAPYSVPGADPRKDEFVACVDQAIGKTMQTILHHPDFQTLETNWRALQLLVRRLETGSRLKLFVVDVSQQELAEDLTGDDLAATGLYRLLAGSPRGGSGPCPYALTIGAYRFGNEAADVELLGRIAQVAAATGTPWLSSAKGDVVGCPAPDQTPDVDDWVEPQSAPWSVLQSLAESNSIGVLWPRFLTRMPYGRKTNPIESFQFEELAPTMRHDDLAWGNSAFLAGLAAGEAFTEAGWDLEMERTTEIESLPTFTFEHDGESALQTPSELLFGERGIERLAVRGVIPVLSIRDHDALRLGRLRAVNGQPLAGRWS